MFAASAEPAAMSEAAAAITKNDFRMSAPPFVRANVLLTPSAQRRRLHWPCGWVETSRLGDRRHVLRAHYKRLTAPSRFGRARLVGQASGCTLTDRLRHFR
jgi:hypothetical protein